MYAGLEFNPALYKKRGASFALWKLPGNPVVNCLIAKDAGSFDTAGIQEKEEGFAFVPFDMQEDAPPLFLKGQLYTCSPTDITTSLADYYINKNELLVENEANYVANVTNAVELLKAGRMQKVVLARNCLWPTPKGFCPYTFFNRLCAAYPEAFVSLVSIKKLGTWIGATPEYLLKVTPDNLMTVALAGTQLKGNGQWGEKESEEQLWVLKYIRDILEEHKIDSIEVTERRKIQNGPLEHLYNEVYFKKTGTRNERLAAQLLPRLHPTPAVCGTPLEKAAQFIVAHEKFYRNYYTGFLGPVNIKNHTHLFVNLRCMQITADGLVAYAGAGITKDSVPEMERAETENKLNNLRRFL